MRKGIIIIWLTILLTGISALFWYNDWQYRLPTPVPVNYMAVATGEKIDLKLNLSRKNEQPLFLHFFNPNCPCSRFNFKHFKWLLNTYGDKVNFAIVIMSNKTYTEKEIQDKYDIKIPVFFDTAIATSCGVYSTPQAVLIDRNDQLQYRGNYNSSRYCSDTKTEYARIALDALLKNKNVVFDQAALKAYGCELPKCTK
jgi:AhpC/TSA family